MNRYWLVTIVLAASVSPATAQDATTAQIPAQTTAQSVADLEQRLRALEQQVRDLQAELAQRRGAATTPAPVASTAPGALAAAPTGGDQPPPSQLHAYGVQSAGKLLNPDIGIIGNVISASGESRGGSDSFAPSPFMTLQESEASLQAIVDPYARADFFLAIGEEGIEVEEGYVTFPTVPGGLLVKVGRMRANFGRLNAFHNHTLPWTDRPLAMYNLQTPTSKSARPWAAGTTTRARISRPGCTALMPRSGGSPCGVPSTDRLLAGRSCSGAGATRSAVLTFWPSEFSQIRGQYRRTRFGDGSPRIANELLVQVLFTIGAHGAHAF